MNGTTGISLRPSPTSEQLPIIIITTFVSTQVVHAETHTVAQPTLSLPPPPKTSYHDTSASPTAACKMVFLHQILLPTVAFSALALAAPQPMSKLRRDSDPLSSNFPSDFDRGECAASPDYGSDEGRKSAWEAARGSELIDAYLNQNSRDDWATTIFKKLFPEESSSFDCWTSESTCDTNGHACCRCSSSVTKCLCS